MKKYIILLSAVLAAVSCYQKEVDVLKDADSMSFTAIMETIAPTKTYLGEESDGKFPVYWSEGDKIKMFVSQHEISDGEGYQLDLQSGAGTVESVFSGNVPELPDGSLYYYAVYPYSLGASIGGSGPSSDGQSPAEGTWDPGDGNIWELANFVQIPLPSVQKYAPNSFGRDYNPALAVSRDQTLRFKNICGLLRITLTGNVKVGKITVQADNDAALWGVLMARFRWRQKSSEMEFVSYVINGESSNEESNDDRSLLTLDCEDGVVLSDTPKEFYIVVPVNGNGIWWGGDFSEALFKNPLEDGFTLRVYDTEGNEVLGKHTSRDNSIHRTMIRDMPTLDVRTRIPYVSGDLSVNETANSYIVAPNEGPYCFFAGYKGNGCQPLHDNPAYLQNAVVDVLWETKMSGTESTNENDIIKNVTYNPKTQYISFKSTQTPGNALIALKANDKVLWSWHIWSTDYDPSTNYDVYGSAVLMDRNLGALKKTAEEVEDVSFYGLYYQWGRKDPFDKSYDERKYIFSKTEPFSVERDVNKTVAELIEIPTTYIYAMWDIYKDMSHTDMATLWGKKKTVYDPCPPGWQVADRDTYYQYAQSYSTPNFVVQYSDNYALFMHSSPDAIYPTEDVWTNHHNLNYYGAACYTINGLGKERYSNDPKHVRCQLSNTALDTRPVIDLSANGTANTYMARPKNKYKFNASVKGNSNISVGMPANAKIEVYTENINELHGSRYSSLELEDVLIADCYLKDGYIYFSTSLDDLYGNATIVVKDPQGDILWSWQIWIVDYDPSVSYDEIDWGEEGVKHFMKMNLGALNNAQNTSQSMGMMYQWGRKDPFMGAVAFDSNSQVVYETYSQAEYGSVEASESTSNLAYSLRHPGIAVMDEINGDGDWLSQHNNALWGPAKTMYDPCPPGWKVPSRPIYNNKVVASEYNYGMLMNDVWYPAAGFHHSYSFNLNEVGKEGHYWYATPASDGSAYAFYFNSRDKVVDLANHADPKAQCNSVRCMKE